MDKVFGIIGTFFLVILLLILFLLLLLLLICISHPKIIIKYKDKLEIKTKLWFFGFDITKFLSRKKKEKKPKVIHFDGGLFGEFPEEVRNIKKKKSAKSDASHAFPLTKEKSGETGKASSTEEKEKKPLTETVSDAVGLVTDILDNIKEPLKKVLRADIKRLYITASSDDSHKTAILFGNMNTALGTLILVCKKYAALNIDEEQTGVYSDFLSVKPSVDAHIVLTLSFRHLIICGFKAINVGRSVL